MGIKNKVEKVYNEGLICPTETSLTNAEKEVLNMITEKFYTLKQIVLIRKTSPQAVYKIIRKLKQKGALNIGLQRGLKSQGSHIKPLNQIRLHGQEFNIKILWQDNRYQTNLIKSNIRFIEGHTIKLYRNSIEIYSGEGISFYGENVERVDKKAMDYWTQFFTRLEHELNIVVIKNNSSNIKEVNHHYERGNSEICQNAKDKKEIIRIYAVEDGKLAYWTDSSFGGDNDETGHPQTAKPDRKAIDKQVNDWRLNNPPTNSELADNINNFVMGFDNYGKHIVSHVSVLDKIDLGQRNLSKSIKQLTRVMKGILTENQNLKLESKHQTRLGEFI